MAGEPMTLLVLTGPGPLSHWEQMTIDALCAVDGVTVELKSTDDADPDRDRKGWPWSQWLFRRYVREAKTSGALAAATRSDGLQAFTAKGHPTPDVVLCLGGATAPKALLTKYGTWQFLTSEGTRAHELPPGVHGSLLRRTSTQFHLVDLTHDRLLCTGCFPVLEGDPFFTTDLVLEHAASWPARVLHDILRTGTVANKGTCPSPEKAEIPDNFTMLAHRISRMFGGIGTTHGGNGTVPGDWNIGLLHQPIHVLLQEGSSMNVRWFPSPSKDRGRLEPFGYFAADGEFNVVYRKTAGTAGGSVIARLRPKPDNILKRSRTMLDLGSGHAYPYVLRIDDAVYILRSSITDDRTDIHRINAMNDGVEPSTTLLPMALHAPTLFVHDGRWWLMGTRDPLGDAALHIFHSDSPFGPFTAHVHNPVKCDVRSARPAGTPFVHNGTLWRPALDATDPGMCAVVFNKVLELGPDRFTEEVHRRVEGFPATAYGNGVRTLCAMGDVTLVDGLRSPVLTANKANASRSRKKRRSTKQEDE